MYVKYFAAKFPCFFYIYILLATRNCRQVGAYSKVGHKRAVSPPEKNLQQASKFTRRLLSIIFLNLTSVSVFHVSLTLSNKKVTIATFDRLGISKEGKLDNESCKLNTIIQTSSTEYQAII